MRAGSRARGVIAARMGWWIPARTAICRSKGPERTDDILENGGQSNGIKRFRGFTTRRLAKPNVGGLQASPQRMPVAVGQSGDMLLEQLKTLTG